MRVVWRFVVLGIYVPLFACRRRIAPSPADPDDAYSEHIGAANCESSVIGVPPLSLSIFCVMVVGR